MLVDTHCHLDLLDDADAALERATTVGVERVITIGVDLATSEDAVRRAEADERVFATVGLHPHDAKDWTPSVWDRIGSLATHPRVVGVGEGGLDFHYDNSPRPQQREVFARHIALAHETDRTLVIHSREAWDDTFRILEEGGQPARTVYHCFIGGPAEAERALGMGAVLSFSGIVTFANADAVRQAALLAPLDRILIETDAPFLTPVPHRGRPNEPAYVEHTAAFLADLKGVTLKEFSQVTTANAERMFRLP